MLIIVFLILQLVLCLLISNHGHRAGMIGVDAVHLMALHEQEETDTEAAFTQLNRVRYGFAFLDAAAGRFYVGSASDDASRANLGALLTQVSLFAMSDHSNTCRSPTAVLTHGYQSMGLLDLSCLKGFSLCAYMVCLRTCELLKSTSRGVMRMKTMVP